MAIAHAAIASFADVITALPRLAPPGMLPPPGTPVVAPPTELLSDELAAAHPQKMAIIGIIDHAIPFAHPRLRAGDASRVASIWLQDARPVRSVADLPFGAEITGRDIDALLAGPDGKLREAEAAYRALGLHDPARRGGAPLMRAATHGAAVAGLAAGFAPDDPQGRRHPVVAVSLPDFSIADTSGTLAGLFLQAGVMFIVSRARILSRQLAAAHPGRIVRPPLVINLSMGITAGAPDGQSALERLQDAIAGMSDPELGPVHFVLPTGNSRLEALHGELSPGQKVGWHLPPDDRTPSALEIRPVASALGPLALSLQAPDGQRTELRAGSTPAVWRLTDADGTERLRLVQRPEGHGRGALTLIAPPTLPDRAGAACAAPGIWRIGLLAETGFACTLDIQRDDSLPGFRGVGGRQSRLIDPLWAARDDAGRAIADDLVPGAVVRCRGTINRYAGGARILRAGAVRGQPRAVSSYGSLLTSGRPGDLLATVDRSASLPGMAAPGVAPGSSTVISGTSLAAPQVTRWLAGRLAEEDRPVSRNEVIALAGAAWPRLGGVPLLG